MNTSRFRYSAFSLVEVVLALGLVSFALIAVLGLLPVGLRAVKDASEQAGAANVLNSIAEALRSASSVDAQNYTSDYSGQVIQYAVGGAARNILWPNLTLDGAEESAQTPRRLSAVLNIIPGGDATTPSRAIISVAWSAQAAPVWDGDKQSWSKADGSIISGVQFLPRP